MAADRKQGALSTLYLLYKLKQNHNLFDFIILLKHTVQSLQYIVNQDLLCCTGYCYPYGSSNKPDRKAITSSHRRSKTEECGQTSLPQVLVSPQTRCSECLKQTLGPSELEIHTCNTKREKQKVAQVTQFAVTNLKPINLCHLQSFSQ